MKFRVVIAFLLAFPLYASEEMRKLDWLAGDWSGEASVQMGPGKPQQVAQSERVQSKLGGKVLVIEGLGKRKLDDGSAGEVVHDALAVISWDDKARRYRFDAWTAREGYVEAWLETGEGNSVTWGFDTPQGGRIRYTIWRDEKNQWREVGKFSRDGNEWMQFFEMTLRKTR